MIASLRQRHRWIVTTLLVVIVALYVWAIMARKAVPRVRQVPGAHQVSHGTERVIE